MPRGESFPCYMVRKDESGNIAARIENLTSSDLPAGEVLIRVAYSSLNYEGYRLVGLEQASNSKNLHQFSFVRRTALVIGNERTGLTEDVLAKLDDVVVIPVWGLPYSYNVATATAMTLYEYCRQFPEG